MKKCLLIALLCTACAITAQERSETIKKTLSFTNTDPENLLVVENIFGNIEVQGHAGNKIELEVIQTIKAKSSSLVNQGFEEVELGIVERANFMVLYMKTPCGNNEIEIQSLEDLKRGWCYNNTGNCQWNPKYSFRLDFKLRVPEDLNVRVSTINDGEVNVAGILGKLHANNINGSINLDKIGGPTNVHTINGDVNIIYRNNPNEASSYYTLNGDINTVYQKGISADLFFTSQYGDLYTDIDPIVPLPAKLEKTNDPNQKGIAYKIGGNGFKIRDGGIKLEFETFNGDVIIKEN